MAVLTDLLAGTSVRANALDAFVLARRRFEANERIDMGKLADEVGVSRVTLNRWVGSRDLLLAEILWSVAKPALEQARAEAGSTGGAKVAETLHQFLVRVLGTTYFRGFLDREPDIALRVLTTGRTPFQGRVADWVAVMLTEEAGGGLPLPPEDMGYLLVRIGESFCYIDQITGGTPNAEKAKAAFSAILCPR